MGRTKDQSVFEKVKFPEQQEIRDLYFNPRKKLTLPKVPAQQQEYEESKPVNQIKQIQDAFKNHLLSSPLFESTGSQIKFINPKSNRISLPLNQSQALLNGLSLILARFFFYEKIKTHVIGTVFDLEEILKKLISIKPTLIKSKIHEETINSTLVKIIQWQKKTYRYIDQTTEPTLIEKKLVPLLQKVFKIFSTKEQLSDNAIDMCVSIILNHFGLEKGSLKSLSAKIKQARMRKRTGDKTS
jgi:hypothetical protein